MNKINHIIIGLIIGVANIIPGVSGGTMAVSLGIYDKLIQSVTNLRNDWKASVKFLLPIIVGAGFAIGALSFLIVWLFEEYPFETNMAFIGLIIGGLPAIVARTKETQGKKLTISNILAFVLFFSIVVGMAFLGDNDNYVSISLDLWQVCILFFVGVIAAATMVIPGVSGSMVLMLLGYYQPILGYIQGFLEALGHLRIGDMVSEALVLLPFGIGVLVGIFAIAKMIEIIFARWPLLAYFAIVGLIVASPVAVMVLSPTGQITVMNIIVGAIAFTAGAYISSKLGE